MDKPRFLDRGEILSVRKGESLWTPSGECRAAFVMSGCFKYFIKCSEEKFSVQCGPSSFLGIVECCWPGNRRLFSAVALEDSEAYCWSRSDFLQVMGIYQELARDVIETLSGRLRYVNRVLERDES